MGDGAPARGNGAKAREAVASKTPLARQRVGRSGRDLADASTTPTVVNGTLVLGGPKASRRGDETPRTRQSER